MKHPMVLALGILGVVALGAAIAQANAAEIKMPSFTNTAAPTTLPPNTIFFAPMKGANTMVAFGGSCMDQEAFDTYITAYRMTAIAIGTAEPGRSFGIFDRGGNMEIMIGDGKGTICTIALIKNVRVFDQPGDQQPPAPVTPQFPGP